MKRFASAGQAQRLLFVFSYIRGHFRPRRQLISAPQWRTETLDRFAVWDEITAAAAARKTSVSHYIPSPSALTSTALQSFSNNLTMPSSRTDRVLPNGVCLLPPLKTCDKGNSCLSCGHFATDDTHTAELEDQYAKTTALIEVRRRQHRERTGRELTDDNVWIAARRRELHSLQAILDRLAAEDAHREAIAGARTAGRIPIEPVATRGAHDSALRKGDPHMPA